MPITTCTVCGVGFEVGSEERANEPARLCRKHSGAPMRKRPLTATMEMRRAVAGRNWAWAEEIACERMRGSLARKWLRKIWRLMDEELGRAP